MAWLAVCYELVVWSTGSRAKLLNVYLLHSYGHTLFPLNVVFMLSNVEHSSVRRREDYPKDASDKIKLPTFQFYDVCSQSLNGTFHQVECWGNCSYNQAQPLNQGRRDKANCGWGQLLSTASGIRSASQAPPGSTAGYL